MELEAALVARTVDEWLNAFLDAGVPAGPILDYAESLADPHTLARGMVQHLKHPVEGMVPALGIPAKLSATPGALRTAAPLLGEHTEDVLRSVGYEQSEIDRLLAKGSVFSLASPTARAG